MKKAHYGKPPVAISDSIIANRDKENKSRIDRLIKKSKEIDQRNVFEKILDNFF